MFDSGENVFIKSLKCDACHGVMVGFDAIVTNALVVNVVEDLLIFGCSIYVYHEACSGFVKNLG